MHLKQEEGIESGRKILGKLVLGAGRLEVWERGGELGRILLEGGYRCGLRFQGYG